MSGRHGRKTTTNTGEEHLARIAGESHGGVDTRRLYDWLGRMAKFAEAEYCEEAVNLDISAGTMYRAEAFAEVRKQMRRFDETLPYEAIDSRCW